MTRVCTHSNHRSHLLVALVKTLESLQNCARVAFGAPPVVHPSCFCAVVFQPHAFELSHNTMCQLPL